MESSKEFWDKVYQENAPKLIGVCRRYVTNRDLAEDLVHDAFLTAIDKHSTYSGKGSFEGWLRQIVINTALMYLRKEKNNKETQNIPDDDINEYYQDVHNEESVRSLIEEAEFSDNDLLMAIDSLPFHHKTVFNLYIIDDYSHKQIANKLSISEGTSKSHLARARKKIQEILYQKAKGEKRNKNKAAAFYPISVKANYINFLFKSKMENYFLQPVKDPSLFMSQVNWSVQIKPAIMKKQMLNFSLQLTKFIILPVVFSVVVIYSTNTFSNNNIFESSIKEDIKVPESRKAETVIDSVNIDTVNIVSKPKADTINYIKPKFKPKIIKKAPVVVKRTIIQRQTIKVQKTVQVYDSTKNR